MVLAIEIIFYLAIALSLWFLGYVVQRLLTDDSGHG